MSVMEEEPARLLSQSQTAAGKLRGLPRYSTATLLGILMLCAVLPYANTVRNGFVYDDHNEVLNNPYIKSFRHVKEIFSTRILAHLGARGVTNYYRPISTFGFLLCYQAFGPLAYGFHLANIILHALVVCLLFAVTERLFRDRALALVTAVVFAFHPIHGESVAWVSAVTDLELAVFYLLAFWCFLGVAGPGGRRSDSAQLGMVSSFVLALLSKESAVTLPLLATIYEHFYRDDRKETTWRQKLPRYFLLWLLAITYLLFRVRFFGSFAPVLLTPQVTCYEAFLSAFALTGQYLWKLLWPVHLSAFYGFHKSITPLDLRVLGGLLALALCAALFVVLWKRARVVSFGMVWFLATLAPVLNARWIGPNVFTERYLYLPSVGLCWVGAWTGLRLWAKVSGNSRAVRRAFIAAVGILAALGIARIATRNRDWRDDITYYRSALEAEPDAAGLRINLGAVYWNTGNRAAAEREWRRAQQFAPGSALVLNNLGLVYAGQKRYEEAVKCFQEAVRLRPNFADAHLNLGRVYAEMGMTVPAELQLRAAVALAPLNIQARNRLGELYIDERRLAEAEEQFLRSVESEANVLSYDCLGDLYARSGRRSPAERAFKEALAMDGFDSRAHFGLAALCEAGGRSAEALREYQAGLQTDPANPKARAAVQKLRSHASH